MLFVSVPAKTGGKFVVVIRKSLVGKVTSPLLVIVPHRPYTSIKELFVSPRRSYQAMNNFFPSGFTASTGIHWSLVQRLLTRTGVVQLAPPFVEPTKKMSALSPLFVPLSA